jgi:two-component system nitrogen regulation response regulator NtrX
VASKILIVDDEESIRETISDILKDDGYEVITAADGEEGQKKALLEDIDAVILDVLLPKKGGMDVLSYMHGELPLIPAIIISGHGDIKMAVEAMKRGAFDFIEKPLSIERILSAVRNAVKMKELQMENLNLKSKLEKPVVFIGESPSIRLILESLPNIAQSNASVLITGENGTGKELIARMIHNQSQRKNFPFIGVNCASIPENLIESELFGYERGAFTGAFKQRKGKFESANRGTIFLDEIGDLSLSAQAKVLRVIQEREIERVGGNGTVKIDVRILAATNKNLDNEIREARFRQDLFYRLNVIPISIPPLRERKEDIPLLAANFIEDFNLKNEKSIALSKKALNALSRRFWAGNVRELKNFVERLAILSGKGLIDANDVLKQGRPDDAQLEENYVQQALKDAKQEFEKNLITDRLIRFHYNITKASESLGIDRTYLHKKIKELDIQEESYFPSRRGDRGGLS